MEKLSNEDLKYAASMASEGYDRAIEWAEGYVVHRVEISQVIAELLSTRAQLAALQEKVRWVPVSERLPEEGKPVLVDWIFNPMSDDPVIDTAKAYLSDNVWTCLEWPCDSRNIDDGLTPTHWMPLPPIPAEGEND